MSSCILLPVERPIVASWANQAHVFSIAQRHPSYPAWIYSGFLQLELIQGLNGQDTVVNYSHHTTPEQDCPWIDVSRITFEEIEAQGNWIDFYKQMLSEGKYIYQFVNQYDIPGYFHYQSRVEQHDPLIIGFDEEREVFILLDYHRDKSGSMYYGHFEVKYEHLEQGIRSLPARLNWLGCVELWQYKPEMTYDFDVKGVMQALSDYLNSTYTPHREPTWISTPVLDYGMNIYKHLFRQLEAARTSDQTGDFRFFHVLSDHKILMLERLKYMHQQGLIREASVLAYGELYEEISTVRALLLKFGLVRRVSTLDKIVSILQSVVDNERQILTEVYDELKQLQLHV
ncbi:hypothetical protein [Paenibacillus xylaniclasticus]|uniref:hypothetical protein n=1 Tax=Paenibacillus xylaniclasticus TaxID=588083 RepID=UPI000FDBBF6F|nr:MULTISPECIES: hypothetical protein [Paenibacillus]GFN33043.1 hypothetical protein PCURB6_33030 [Paenibacillus curdlanolyticus]